MLASMMRVVLRAAGASARPTRNRAGLGPTGAAAALFALGATQIRMPAQFRGLLHGGSEALDVEAAVKLLLSRLTDLQGE